MPGEPFPVTGKIYDLYGNAMTSGVVYAWNYTNDEKTRSTINASGEFSLDLSNLTSGYETGDVIYLYYMDIDKNAVTRAVLASGDDSWSQDLYCKQGEAYLKDCRVNSLLVANNSGSDISVSLVDLATEDTRVLYNISNNGMQSGSIDERAEGGIRFKEGFFPLITAQGTNVYTQSTGVSNAIGDTENSTIVRNKVIITVSIR